MIAIDTSVLLRHVLNDDKDQSSRAATLIEGHGHVLITDVVLCETVWTLLGKKYRAAKGDIIKLVSDLLAEPCIMFESPAVIWAALNDYRKAGAKPVSGRKEGAGFTAALIVNKTAHIAGNRKLPRTAVYTYDKVALTLPGVKYPG